MSYNFYKILHIAAVLGIFTSLGATCFHAMNGGSRTGSTGRAIISTLHAAGLLLALVAGFGLLARLEMISSWPGWVYAKLAIWLLVGALAAVPYRKPELARPVLLLLPLLGLAAAWLAIAKPF